MNLYYKRYVYYKGYNHDITSLIKEIQLYINNGKLDKAENKNSLLEEIAEANLKLNNLKKMHDTFKNQIEKKKIDYIKNEATQIL